MQATLAVWLVGQVEAPEVPEPPNRAGTGAFSQLLQESRFVKPGVWTAKAASEDPVADAEPELLLPGDFQRHAALVLVADKLAADFPQTFARIVAAARPTIEVVGLVADDAGRKWAQRVLAEHAVAADRIDLVQVPTDTVWIRDFGPVFVRRRGGTRAAFDFEYRRRSGSDTRDRDDAAAAAVARHFRTPVRRVPIELEQGNLLSNGRDVLVTTTDAFNVNIRRGYDARTFAWYLRRSFGCRRIVALAPLIGEPTGHVDVFACFVAPNTIVVGKYLKSVDPLNADVLDRNAAILSNVQTSTGPLRVVRVAMPDNEDDLWRTYTNGVFANGVLLLPQYAGAHGRTDRLAAETFRRLLPGRRVVGIDAGKLITREGAFRCVTLPVPASRAGKAGDSATAD